MGSFGLDNLKFPLESEVAIELMYINTANDHFFCYSTR